MSNYIAFHSTEILTALEGDKSRTNGLIAEVRDQSADDLVDGISAREEERYNYDHYFGGTPNRYVFDQTFSVGNLHVTFSQWRHKDYQQKIFRWI